MAKPILFVIVRAVPLSSGGEEAATIVENCGESEITTMPHIHNAIINQSGGNLNNRGETKQNTPEMSIEL